MDKVPLFVVLSGYDEFDYVRDTMKMGAFNYLLKPINMEELKKLMEEAKEKINKVTTNNRIYNKSLEIMKKEFFKSILFSNKTSLKAKDNILLHDIQFDEAYVYKLIIADIKNEKENKEISAVFINMVMEDSKKLEYCSFYYKNQVYIIFYINKNKYENAEEIIENIDNKSDIFNNNNINVYINKSVNEVYKLKNQVQLTECFIENNKAENIKAEKYFLYDEKEIDNVISKKETLKETTVIKLAKEYIMFNYNKNITLKNVADEVYLNQNYLSELFKKEMGEGFYDFISKYRVKKAKQLLLTTNLKVYEIAERVGYSDSISFGRVFKKITGCTPNSFRNNNFE